jgi:hypothetical protein
MSYDLTLFRPKPGIPIEEAAQKFMEEEEANAANATPPDAATKDRMRALATALVSKFPSLNMSDHTDDAHSNVELDRSDAQNGIQISIFPDTAAITVPYWHTKEEADAVMKEIWDYLRVLEKVGEYRTYDPQLDRVLDLEKDYTEALTVYGGTSEKIPTMMGKPSQEILSKISKYHDNKPWWKFWGN